MSDRLRQVEEALEERTRRRLELDAELRRLFAERQTLDEQIEGLARVVSVANGIVDGSVQWPDGRGLMFEAKAVARRGSLLGTVADILRLEGRGLHADEIVQRLEALGMRADKKALVAQLASRVAAGNGFQRSGPNTFVVVIDACASSHGKENETGSSREAKPSAKKPARRSSDGSKRTRGARHPRR